MYPSWRANERLLYSLFFVQPTSEIEFMALFSLLVDNTYRRLLDVKRDSRYYSEIMESLWCFFHLIHAEERKSYEGNSSRYASALIRFKVGKNNFSEGPRSYDSFFFVDRFAKETRKFFNFSLLDGSAESFKYFPQCLQVRKAIVRFM